MNKTHRDEGDDDARCRRRRSNPVSTKRGKRKVSENDGGENKEKKKKKEEGPFSFILSSCPAALVCMCVCTYVFVEICALPNFIFLISFSMLYFRFSDSISPCSTIFLSLHKQTNRKRISNTQKMFHWKKKPKKTNKHTTTTKWIKMLKEFLEKLFPSPDFFFGSANERTNEESPHTHIHTRKKKMVEVTPRLDSSHIIVGTRPPRLSLFPNVYHNF